MKAEEEKKLAQELERVLKEVLEIARLEGKKTGFCIGNTTKKIKDDYFFTPIRDTSRCVCGSVIIDRVSIAEMITRTLDGRVDYLFIDTEKKISKELYGANDVGNVERAVRTPATRSKILTYKGNDLTVDAIDCFLAQKAGQDIRGLGAKKIAIIGAGNTGFKLALKLTERGANVVVVRRDKRKLEAIVRALNYIKPPNTIAQVSGTSDIRSAIQGADIVIGLTPGTQDITREMIGCVKEEAVLIDAGKGSFSIEAIQEAEQRGLDVYRTSITASFEGQISMLLSMEEILEQGSGRNEIEGISIVSGGIVGHKGDVVVDNVFEPKQIYGVADGCGDFDRDPSTDDQEKIRLLTSYIKHKQKPASRFVSPSHSG